ncbi:MAG: ABC transporter ATP-binding protein/permease [Thermodesulfobacteriota bacterium]
MTWAIETFSLTKYFPTPGGGLGLFGQPRPSRAAVDGVSLAIRPGELFGLLGPNGAGKTTLIKMLATLIIPSSGNALVNGCNLAADKAVRDAIAVVSSDERSFYWRLTGRQNLEFFSALYHLSPAQRRARIREVLHLVGLEEGAEVPVKAFSSGMKQRLAIARALLALKPILLLDEPTKGLDPPAIRQLHQLIREELTERRGITVLLTTHQLWEAEALCHRVAVMHQGRLKGCGTPWELRRDLGLMDRWRLLVPRLTPALRGGLEKVWPRLRFASQDNGQVLLEWEAENQALADDIVGVIFQEGEKILSLSREPASLEVIFDTLTQRPDSQGSQSQKSGPEPPDKDDRRHREELPPNIGVRAGPKGTPGIFRNWLTVAAAFFKRDMLEEWSYRLSFSLQLISIFFSVTMFYFLSRLFGQSVNQYLSPYGTDYFSFVLMGIAFSQYFDVGLSTFSNSLREAQTTGTLEAMFTSPTSISLIIISSSLWSYLFASLQVLIYLVMGTVLFKARLVDFSLPAVIVILSLTIVCFSSLGLIAASFIMLFKRGDPVLWLFSTSSALLSGVYYPLAILPEWLRSLSYFLPNTYILEAVRLALLQGCPLAALKRQLAFLVLFCVILVPLSLWAFRWAVYRAKVAGTLTHY